MQMSGYQFIIESSQWYLMTAINSLCYCVKSNLIVFDCALGGSHKRILFGYLRTIRTINQNSSLMLKHGQKLVESHHSHVSLYCYLSKHFVYISSIQIMRFIFRKVHQIDSSILFKPNMQFTCRYFFYAHTGER